MNKKKGLSLFEKRYTYIPLWLEIKGGATFKLANIPSASYSITLPNGVVLDVKNFHIPERAQNGRPSFAVGRSPSVGRGDRSIVDYTAYLK